MSGEPSILNKIFEAKRLRVERQKADLSSGGLDRFRDRACDVAQVKEPFRLSETLKRKDRVNIIAEFKRASPSKGVINDTAEPAEKAKNYEQAGAAAVSVLTEEDHFQGSLTDLEKARSAISIPILRKDFIFDPFQIHEAAIAGADAILLIAAMLDDELIEALMTEATAVGLDSLVEVHNLAELGRVKKLGAMLIGVNNRDLNTFEVSLDHSRELIRRKPEGALMISESGISTPEQIEELRDLGFDGFLIGESLMSVEENKIDTIFSLHIDQ